MFVKMVAKLNFWEGSDACYLTGGRVLLKSSESIKILYSL